MKNRSLLCIFLVLITFSGIQAQTDSLSIQVKEGVETEVVEKDYEPYNALAPAKAAFYSAILPGLGQAYNGSYWKIPIAYGGLATGIYYYLDNDKQYSKYRDAYKNRIAGREDQFNGKDEKVFVSTDGLIRAQEVYQKNKEISLLVTVGVYILNIIDANVEAHLRQFNVDEDLTLQPNFDFNSLTGKTNYGLTLNFNF
ncbi:DUF5683 domain-containing protein [Christiangramia sp. OXR-203]|uniref:DUF5683 domain-containing protein n=1 Tax=Christiangramia sp. OXR-203 TaxID=3100176 RepID=UPI002AC9860E|nr:DUF5683 domain-containing protein [Christiangramia sp. OXR-203]WPY97731.1 DUF5683 domain-containing protein [Christiangramia sp. OXR-203]